MDLKKILKQVKSQKSIIDGLNIHVEKMHNSNKKELENMMPNFYSDLQKMVKENDFEGIKAKNKEVLKKIKEKEDASKRNNND